MEFKECKWCKGSGDDGGGYGACPDCESTGLEGGRSMLKLFDEQVEKDFINHKEKPTDGNQ